jgi:2-phosphoglycerate kinase
VFTRITDLLIKTKYGEGEEKKKVEGEKLTSVTTTLFMFRRLLDDAFREHKLKNNPKNIDDFMIASDLIQSKKSVIVLLAGASGTGKSTLASMLARRFGIQTVLSTDSIRHIMRNFLSQKDNPLLFCSTYECHKHVPLDGG